MIDKTLEGLLVEVEASLYQTAGISTQVYSQQLLVNKITDAFIILATDPEKNWKRFRTTQTYTLDGVTGRTTLPVKNTFVSFDTVNKIWVGSSERFLVAFPDDVNPTSLSGAEPLFYVADQTDTFRVIPTTATGMITVQGFLIPHSFQLDDIVPFDYLALKYFVCWQYMTDDGSNPGAAEKFQQLFNNRLQQISASQDKAPIALDGHGMNDYPRTWYVQ
jgi:hypothetical protein